MWFESFLLSIALLFPKTPLLVDKDIDSLDNQASRSEKDQHQALVSNHCNCWFMFWFWNSLQWFFHNAHKKIQPSSEPTIQTNC